MSESALGLSVAATRHTAGRSANGLAAAGPAPPPRVGGGGSAPAGTNAAAVIVTFGSVTFVSAAHDSADGADWPCSATAGRQMRPAAIRARVLTEMRWTLSPPDLPDPPDQQVVNISVLYA